MTEALIQQLLADKPAFHAWPDGTPANWSVAPDVLRSLAALVKSGMNTLETGAGQTTVAFALGGANHVCITPDTAQAEKIQRYLGALGVTASVRFIHQSSDEALPAGRGISEQLDIVLIDGAHRFPLPILDWYYTQARVPVGGLMIVDDYKMPSVRILYDFLQGEDEWELAQAFEITAFFRRVKETVSVWDWADQRINKPHLDRIRQKTESSTGTQNLSALFKRWLGARS
jgi:predicted O-methyltransferase YrrM